MQLPGVRLFSLRIFLLFSSISFSQTNINELYKQAESQFKKGKYDDALIVTLEALKIAEKNNNCSELANALLQVGIREYYINDKRKALTYCFKSLDALEGCKIDTLKHIIYSDIGGIYTELGKNDSALFYLKRTREILDRTTNYGALSKVNAVLADLHLWNFNDLKTGEKYLLEAEKYAQLSKNKTWIAFALMKRGILYRSQKNYPKALESFKSALKNYEELDLVEGRSYALGMILGVVSITGSSDVRDHMGKFLALKDSIFNAEMAKKTAEYKTIYETEKKEAENKLLQQKDELNKIEIESKNKAIIGLLIGVLLIVITIFWRISVINLKKKNRELEAAQTMQKEKERISRDLHDNVGGQLSYVLYSLDGVVDDDKQKRVELTSNINASIRNVISNLRETIWAISDESITINDLSDKLKVYARGMFKNSETTIIFNEQISENSKLNSVVGLNLYRICQEIINNAFKYSQAKELKVNISVDDKIRISISDNGIGFEPGNEVKGLGLSNIKARASEVGIKLEMKASKGEGVHYKLIV